MCLKCLIIAKSLWWIQYLCKISTGFIQLNFMWVDGGTKTSNSCFHLWPQIWYQMHLQPIARYRKKSQPEMRGSLALRGGLLMMSKSGGLKPRAVAGRPSVTRLTHSNCTGIRASGNPKAAVRKMLRQSHKKVVQSDLEQNSSSKVQGTQQTSVLTRPPLPR